MLNLGQKNMNRKKIIITFFLLVLSVFLYFVLPVFISNKTVSTDNAYTAAELAEITPRIEGPIKKVKVINTQFVHVGDVLVVIDDTDARIAFMQAESNLETARRKVMQIMANDIALNGNLRSREANILESVHQVNRAQAHFDKVALDVKRRKNLIKTGAISEQDFTNAKTELREASAMLESAKSALKAAQADAIEAEGTRKANETLFIDTTIDNNPIVLAAKSRLEQARTNLDRTIIRAPVSGIITQRTAEVGRFVKAGERLMRIVPLEGIYVNANFKENQLKNVRVGQKVELISDLYGSSIIYHGKIVGFDGGTGSALSLIPAQNATGNWIKVIQRLPVRIHLTKKELLNNPLRVGLSMVATVDLTSDDVNKGE